MRGLITAGGDLTNQEIFSEEYDKADIRIAVDSGIEFYYRYKKLPEMVLGDFDSISKDGKEFISDERIETSSFPPEKDYTDLELGIEYLAEKGCRKIVILGAVGDRIDHSLANLFMMVRFYKKGIDLILKNNLMKIQVVEGEIEIQKDYKFLSVVPVSQEGIEITLEGFYYPLKNHPVEMGSTLAVSNFLTGERGRIKISKGTGFVIETNEK